MKKERDSDHLSMGELEFESFNELAKFILQLFPKFGKIDDPRIKIRYNNKALVSIDFSEKQFLQRFILLRRSFG